MDINVPMHPDAFDLDDHTPGDGEHSWSELSRGVGVLLAYRSLTLCLEVMDIDDLEIALKACEQMEMHGKPLDEARKMLTSTNDAYDWLENHIDLHTHLLGLIDKVRSYLCVLIRVSGSARCTNAFYMR